MRNPRISGLYAITPDLSNTDDLLNKTQQALEGGARLVQYRNKSAGRILLQEQAKALLQLCRKHAIPLIINDHIDLAMAIDADGVHVGLSDIPVSDARKRLGPGKIVGASCYNNLELALHAEESGSDYVAFGAFFSSLTKTDTVPVSTNLVDQAKLQVTIPIVGIGGIQLTNVATVIQCGCDAIAVCNDLFETENIRAKALQYARLFAEESQHNLI